MVRFNSASAILAIKSPSLGEVMIASDRRFDERVENDG